MRLSCLVFLAVISLGAVVECKPMSDGVEKAPCVDCEQKNLRRKRSYQVIFAQAVQGVKLGIGCLKCFQRRYVMTYTVPVYRGPDVYIGNGQNNVNHVVINGANNVYIGNGAHNTNYVSYG